MKYEMNVKMCFETKTDLPDTEIVGNLEVVQNAFSALPSPEDIDESTTVVAFSLKKID